MTEMYRLDYSKKALKHLDLLKHAGLYEKAIKLLKIIELNPYQNPPPYEKMVGYSNRYSRRVNVRHRIVYEIYDNIIKIISL